MANENQETEHVEAVAVTTNALEQMERANIDIQISTALAYPRSMEQFYARAIAMVTFDEKTAASCLYSRPVGKDSDTGKQVYAKGNSIRMAEIVAASYGNIRVAGMIIEMEPTYVKAVGIAHDLESNYSVKAEAVESTVTKKGLPFSPRMRVVVAKAAQSKAIRDATFRVIPKSLCEPLAAKAREVAMGDLKTFKSKCEAAVEWIKSLKIAPERVWDAIGINGPKDITKDELVLLAGLKTAIEESDVTVDEAFPKSVAEAAKGSTTERILADNSKKADEKKESEKPPRKPRSDKGTTRGKNLGQHKETAPEQTQEPETTSAPPQEPETETETEGGGEEPKDVKCPKCDHVGDPAIPHTCNRTNDADKPVWKCLRCDRELKDNDKDIKNGQCGYCMGHITELK